MRFKTKFEEIGFERDTEHPNVFLDKKSQIEYSDGQVEDKIYHILKDIPDDIESVRFEYLENNISDWATKYHFAWERQNILKPIDFNNDDIVLELGGGTGILTDYISGRVKNIVCIEGTYSRARSISARCKNRNNVDIIVANFLKIDLLSIFGEGSFDKITLMGVLEYVTKYSIDGSIENVLNLLNVCNKLLKDDGELIIAIENKIGLKYLLGWEEDHVGKEYYGIQSFYRCKDDVTTFTKNELKGYLELSNFNSIDFYYPFPDYKLPSIIVKEGEYLANEVVKRLLYNLLYDIKIIDYSSLKSKDIKFGRVLNNFIQSNDLGNVSNSFLLRAKKYKNKKLNNDIIFYYSVIRRFQYACNIIFKHDDKQILVTKSWNQEKVDKEINFPLKLVKHGKEDQVHIDGYLLHVLLDDYTLVNDRDSYINLIKKWKQSVTKLIETDQFNSFDLVPYNFVVSNGDFLLIDDAEYVSDKLINVQQLIFRYFRRNFHHLNWLYGSSINFKSQILLLLKEIGIDKLTDADYDYIIKLEDFSTNVICRKSYQFQNKKTLKVFILKMIKQFTPPIVFLVFTKVKNLIRIIIRR